MEHIQLERLDYGPELADLQTEWNELLANSVRPTVYASFDYIDVSLRFFKDRRTVFFLLMRAGESGRLLAVFPLSLCRRKIHGVELRVITHALPPQTTEVDKPCPVIHRDSETECWTRFCDYLNNEFTAWDMLDFDELLAGSYLPAHAEAIFPFPSYWTRIKPGPDSPIVKLGGEWEDFWNSHRKLRKKCGRLERGVKDLSFHVTNDPSDTEQCLQEYILLEQKGWKEGDMVGRHQDFYKELLQRLTEKGRVWFGLLRDGDKAVSIEMAFTFLDKVYFCHGAYAPEYADYSPGMVSSCWFIRHFHGKEFTEGDYLAGFAEYVNPWAYRLEHSENVTVRRMNLKTVYLAAWHLLGKLKRRIQCKLPKDEKTGKD